MKIISLLLVMVGLGFAKPPTRFPDILAPFRGIFGSPRSGQPEKNFHTQYIQSDSSGAETGKSYGGDESPTDDGFRPGYFPASYSNSPYDDGRFNSEGRSPPIHFQPEKRPPTPFQSEGRPTPPNFQPVTSPLNGKPIRQRPIHYSPPPQTQHQHQPQQQVSGFTDFSFNPAEFDQATFGGGEERRPSSNSGSALGRGRPFQPSKPIPLYPSSSLPGQGHDFSESPVQNYRPGPDAITITDFQKENNGNSDKGVFFDEIYRQTPNRHPPQSNPIFQGGPIRLSSNGGPSRYSSPFSTNSISSEEVGDYGESRGKKVYFYPAASSDVHYGRPLLMSASSNSPTIMKQNVLTKRNPILLTSPTFEPLIQQYSEPVASASGHGSESQGGANGDRILYHVAGHQGPYSYRFGYDTGAGYNRMFRHEEKDGSGTVKGKYGFHDKDGKLQIVNYSAHPEGGYHSERAH